MKRVSVSLQDDNMSVYDYTIEDDSKIVAVECGDGSFLLIDHTEGKAYFAIHTIQFFEITNEVE